MAKFELNLSSKNRSEPGDAPSEQGLGRTILMRNVHWFTRVRWLVVAAFTAAGLAAHLAPQLFAHLGLLPTRVWLLQLACITAVANTGFWLLARGLTRDSSPAAFKAHLWLQILVDLFVVSVLVHQLGSVSSFAAFTYLFHIVLACIFFSRRASLLVTVVAAVMYLTCVGLEIGGVIHSSGVFIDLATAIPAPPRTAALMASSAVFVWLVVWYFAGTLAAEIRQRDADLISANTRLVEADQEKNRVILRTVHDLKAPFTGIETTIELIHLRFWDQIPEDVKELINRIAVRSQTLRNRIRDILLLADLRSGQSRPERTVRLDIAEIINERVLELGGLSESRKVSVDIDVPPLHVVTQKERMSILISNLLSNAISYSREGGRVRVTAAADGGNVRVSISDQGIGIEEGVLPQIFDEYYRAPEAAKFNKSSTGLGLAIVKEIARQLGLRIGVTSEHGKGTTFSVWIAESDEKSEAGGTA